MMGIDKGMEPFEEKINELLKKIQQLEQDVKDLQRKQQLLQDAFFRMHEEQRRHDRKF